MGSEAYYYHQDEQLSIAPLTDDTGRVRNYYRYNTFGGMLMKEEGVNNRIRYTGQQYDGISGQHHLRAVIGPYMHFRSQKLYDIIPQDLSYGYVAINV